MAKPVIGILMLETRFPRIPGDIGNPRTWPFPVEYEVIDKASAARVVNVDGVDDSLLECFVAAGKRLAAAGAAGLTTSCGFLARYQRELSARLPVPIVTSSLQQIPWIESTLPAGKRAGVITIDSRAFGAAQLRAVGAAVDTPVAGTENGIELTRAIMEDRSTLDPKAAAADVIAAGESLLNGAPDVGAIVLECTNMAPYALALQKRSGLPVYDSVTLVRWLYAGLRPADWTVDNQQSRGEVS